MATRAELMQEIMEMLEYQNTITSTDLQNLGYVRNTVQNAFNQLVAEGKLEKHVFAKSKVHFYTLPGNKPVRKKPLDVSGLSESLLFLMGYTNHVPEEIGRIYETR